jgi:hypothetical protein
MEFLKRLHDDEFMREAAERTDIIDILVKANQNNSYHLRTDGKFVELAGGKAMHSLSSIMFNSDYNGIEAKENAVKSMVLGTYKKSKGDAQAIVDALVKVTKLPAKCFEIEFDGKGGGLNLKESWAKDLAAKNKERMKKEREEAAAAKKAGAAAQRASEKAAKVEADSNKLAKIARQIELIVADVYPDGDPLDCLAPWLTKNFGVDGFDIMDLLDKAAKKELKFKSYQAYVDNFDKERQADSKHW